MRNAEKDAAEMAAKREKMLETWFRIFSEQVIEAVSMQDVANAKGRTVLFVSHNMGAVKNLCKTGIQKLCKWISDSCGKDQQCHTQHRAPDQYCT